MYNYYTLDAVQLQNALFDTTLKCVRHFLIRFQFANRVRAPVYRSQVPSACSPCSSTRRSSTTSWRCTGACRASGRTRCPTRGVRESCASASVPFPGTVCVQPLLVHEAQLHDLLAVYGRVQSVWTDPMSNTGYVKFSSIEEASSVVREDRAHH